MNAEYPAFAVSPRAQFPRQRIILQVEDNAANAELIEQLIERRNDLTLVSATTGRGGVLMANSCMPDVILMDINLPDFSGLDAVKLLRANPVTGHIPVIAMSSNAYAKDIQEGLDAGFFMFITKPYKIRDLLDAIDLALDIGKEDENAAD
jgi:CheY-like chemotaxis protein